jgi:SAM-dependent methyltransferase
LNQNKNHWYDGWFYDNFIAPNQDQIFKEIKSIIELNSSVIDVGCGTGRLSFSLSDKAAKVVGIDLSIKNIHKANQNLAKYPNDKISFHHTILSKLISQNFHFNYAVMTYVIHEVNHVERVPLLKEIAEIADKIIIGDYLVPKLKGIRSILNEMVEFAAGSEHYKNYKNYVSNGGLRNLANEAKLKIHTEIKNQPPASHLVVLTR